jgi:predicted alpha/beta hydrolase
MNGTEPRRERIDIVAGDGARSAIHAFPHESATEAPVVVCVPAMGVGAKFYEPLAAALVAEGLNVVTTDLRGNGASSIRARRGSSFGYREIVTYDLPEIVRAVRGRFPRSRVYLLGHSLGGQVSALYLGARPGSVDGAVLVAAGSVYFKAYPFPHSVKILLGTQFANSVSALWGYFPGHRIGFAGREARGVMRDWSRQALTGRYSFRVDEELAEDLLSRARGDMLVISVEHDDLAPVGAVEHLCGKLPGVNISQWHYAPGAGGPKVDHFRWIKRVGPIAERVRSWVEAQVQGRG